MKIKIITLIFICLLITSCSNEKATESNAEPQKNSNQPNIEMRETSNNKSNIYENRYLGFSLEIPSSWQEKYGIDENEKSVSVYHKGTREIYKHAGGLFYVERLEGTLTQEEIQQPGNRFMVLQSNGHTYVFGTPTDVQYPIWSDGDKELNKKLADDYVKLFDDLDKIKKSIRPISITSYVSSDIKRLYELKNTFVGDSSKIFDIVRLLNFTDISVQSIEIKKDNKPNAITVNYKVDSRANYRFFDYSSFSKNAAVMFCLIPSADEIYFRIYDDYGDFNNPETSFVSSYYNREDLSGRFGMEYFVDKTIKNAILSIENFTDYFNKVSAVKNETFYNKNFKGNSPLTEIYYIIGDDCEISTNSGMNFFVAINDKVISNDKFKELMNQIGLNLDQLKGKRIKFLTYEINNFKKDTITYYIFVFDGDKMIAYKDIKTIKAEQNAREVLLPVSDNYWYHIKQNL